MLIFKSVIKDLSRYYNTGLSLNKLFIFNNDLRCNMSKNRTKHIRRFGYFMSKDGMKTLYNRRIVEMKSGTSVSMSRNFIDFTLCSYNILAQYQLENNNYLYSHCQSHWLDWTNRWKIIQEELELLNCDIYCLQEVQCNHYYEDIEPFMYNMGYRGFLSPKTGMKKDGCAIFVREKKFDWENSLTETVQYHNENLRVLRSDNVGQIVRLKFKDVPETTAALCLGNTHLFFNPNAGEVKLAELCVFFAHMNKLASVNKEGGACSSSNYVPTIICGDFNSEPTSCLFRFIVDGKVKFVDKWACDISNQNATSFVAGKDYQKLSADDIPPRIGISDNLKFLEKRDNYIENKSIMKPIRWSCGGTKTKNDDDLISRGSGVISHEFYLDSVYEYSTKVKPRLVTSFTSDDTCAVDFIFYSKAPSKSTGPLISATNLPTLQLMSYLDLLTPEEFLSLGGIPNKKHGSDHLPLVASFRMYV